MTHRPNHHEQAQRSTSEGETYTENRIHELYHFLEAKSHEISKLHLCFSYATQSLIDYQRRYKLTMHSLRQIREDCHNLRNELTNLRDIVDDCRQWRRHFEDRTKEVPHILRYIFKEHRDQLATKMKDQMSAMSKRYQFELLRIYEAQKTELELLKAEYKKQLEGNKVTIHQLTAEVERFKTMEMSNVSNISPRLEELPSKIQERSYESRIRGRTALAPIVYENFMSYASPAKHAQKRVSHQIPRTPTIVKRLSERGNENVRQENYMHKAKASNKSCTTSNIGNTKLPYVFIKIPQQPTTLSGYSTFHLEGQYVYRGLWRYGVFHGRGKLSGGSWTYDGYFRNGVADGLGNLYFNNSTFIGRFQNGVATGYGTLTTNNVVISGIWYNNHLVYTL